MTQMRTYDVIQHSLDSMRHPAERGAHLQRLAQIMQHPNMHVHQFGNTVFMALEAVPGVALLSMHNADSPFNLMHNTIQAMHWLKDSLGLHKVVFQASSPAIHTLAQAMVRRAGIPGMRLEEAPGGREALYLGD